MAQSVVADSDPLAAYFQAILWFPLGSWNDQPGKRLITLLGEGQALAVLAFALAMLLPVLLFALARALNNQQFLQTTYKIFPSSSRHPAPDAMHFVLDVLLFSAVVTIAVGLVATRTRVPISREPSKGE